MVSVIETLKRGGGVPRSPQAIANVAAEFRIEQDVLSAFVDSEATGSGFDSQGRIKVLFEKHHFWRNLPVDKRAAAQAQGLARPNWISPKNGGYRDQPNNTAALSLLERACAIDETAALKSASYGAGQVMGSNYKDLKYDSVQDFVTKMAASEEEQVRVMARFLEKNGLIKHARNKNWRELTKGYNGPGQVDVYAPRLARNYAKHAKLPDVQPLAPGEPPVLVAEKPGVMRRGSHGDAVVMLQKRLTALGYIVDADGDFGRATENALKEFQCANGLSADGVAGQFTLAELAKEQQPVVLVAVVEDSTAEDIIEQGERDSQGITAIAVT